AVLVEAQILANAGEARPQKPAEPPFPASELRRYLEENARLLNQNGFLEIAATLLELASQAEQLHRDLEPLEQLLTALEDKLVATLQSSQTPEQLFEARRELEAQLRPYRGKMTAPQLLMLERQYLERRLLESHKLPRLSLFYLR